ncbi:CsxC family protein [Bacillus cereus]|uniref:CsxC family protein n=1 Tax=Bacillus cereus TaxID=1396 RepID=UPI0005CF7AAC|nr:hypothetical protein [Bacillus cereus]
MSEYGEKSSCNNKGKAEVQFLESASQHECNNECVKPRITKGDIVTRTPVVLTETKVQIVAETIIRFPEPVLEIKSIRKRIKIVQCKLLLPSKKLFLRGFVRKNIQYETPCYGNDKFVSSNLRSLTVDVPFSCVTEIRNFLTKPVFHFNKSYDLEYGTETCIPSECGFDEHVFESGNLGQLNEISEEFFNEQPFCKIIKSSIIDYNEALNRRVGRVEYERDCNKCNRAPFEEGTFTRLEEKMVIELTLKVLQHQQIRVESHDC